MNIESVNNWMHQTVTYAFLASAVGEPESDITESVVASVVAEVQDIISGVRGNRGKKGPISREDARLLISATLDRCRQIATGERQAVRPLL